MHKSNKRCTCHAVWTNQPNQSYVIVVVVVHVVDILVIDSDIVGVVLIVVALNAVVWVEVTVDGAWPFAYSMYLS